MGIHLCSLEDSCQEEQVIGPVDPVEAGIGPRKRGIVDQSEVHPIQ